MRDEIKPPICKCGFKFSEEHGCFVTVDDEVGVICPKCRTYYLDGEEFNDHGRVWVTTHIPTEVRKA